MFVLRVKPLITNFNQTCSIGPKLNFSVSHLISEAVVYASSISNRIGSSQKC